MKYNILVAMETETGRILLARYIDYGESPNPEHDRWEKFDRIASAAEAAACGDL